MRKDIDASLIKSANLRLLVSLLVLGTSLGLLAVAARSGGSGKTQTTERVVENKVPHHVPIKIKLRAEKEKRIKDVNNLDWYRDFELEVTNVSDKPIYYLDLWLIYSDVFDPDGHSVGAVLRYGRPDFTDFGTRPVPEDTPILPGATIFLAIPASDQKGWLAHKLREKRVDPKHLEISLTQLSYGDGTGYRGRDGRSYPFKKDESSNAPCRERPNANDGKGTEARLRFPRLSQAYSSRQRPAAFLPVNFFMDANPNVEPAIQSGLCCPGTQCSYHKNSTYSCSCRTADTIETAGCSDPQGQCSIDEFINSRAHLLPQHATRPRGLIPQLPVRARWTRRC